MFPLSHLSYDDPKPPPPEELHPIGALCPWVPQTYGFLRTKQRGRPLVWDTYDSSALSGHTTVAQRALFDSIQHILNINRLSRLRLSSAPHDALLIRSQLETSATQLRRIFTRYAWDDKLLDWVNVALLDNLHIDMLHIYIDLLRHLRTVVSPQLFDRSGLLNFTSSDRFRHAGELQPILTTPLFNSGNTPHPSHANPLTGTGAHGSSTGTGTATHTLGGTSSGTGTPHTNSALGSRGQSTTTHAGDSTGSAAGGGGATGVYVGRNASMGVGRTASASAGVVGSAGAGVGVSGPESLAMVRNASVGTVRLSGQGSDRPRKGLATNPFPDVVGAPVEDAAVLQALADEYTFARGPPVFVLCPSAVGWDRVPQLQLLRMYGSAVIEVPNSLPAGRVDYRGRLKGTHVLPVKGQDSETASTGPSRVRAIVHGNQPARKRQKTHTTKGTEPPDTVNGTVHHAHKHSHPTHTYKHPPTHAHAHTHTHAHTHAHKHTHTHTHPHTHTHTHTPAPKAKAQEALSEYDATMGTHTDRYHYWCAATEAAIIEARLQHPKALIVLVGHMMSGRMASQIGSRIPPSESRPLANAVINLGFPPHTDNHNTTTDTPNPTPNPTPIPTPTTTAPPTPTLSTTQMPTKGGMGVGVSDGSTLRHGSAASSQYGTPAAANQGQLGTKNSHQSDRPQVAPRRTSGSTTGQTNVAPKWPVPRGVPTLQIYGELSNAKPALEVHRMWKTGKSPVHSKFHVLLGADDALLATTHSRRMGRTQIVCDLEVCKVIGDFLKGALKTAQSTRAKAAVVRRTSKPKEMGQTALDKIKGDKGQAANKSTDKEKHKKQSPGRPKAVQASGAQGATGSLGNDIHDNAHQSGTTPAGAKISAHNVTGTNETNAGAASEVAMIVPITSAPDNPLGAKTTAELTAEKNAERLSLELKARHDALTCTERPEDLESDDPLGCMEDERAHRRNGEDRAPGAVDMDTSDDSGGDDDKVDEGGGADGRDTDHNRKRNNSDENAPDFKDKANQSRTHTDEMPIEANEDTRERRLSIQSKGSGDENGPIEGSGKKEDNDSDNDDDNNQDNDSSSEDGSGSGSGKGSGSESSSDDNNDSADENESANDDEGDSDTDGPAKTSKDSSVQCSSSNDSDDDEEVDNEQEGSDNSDNSDHSDCDSDSDSETTRDTDHTTSPQRDRGKDTQTDNTETGNDISTHKHVEGGGTSTRADTDAGGDPDTRVEASVGKALTAQGDAGVNAVVSDIGDDHAMATDLHVTVDTDAFPKVMDVDVHTAPSGIETVEDVWAMGVGDGEAAIGEASLGLSGGLFHDAEGFDAMVQQATVNMDSDDNGIR